MNRKWLGNGNRSLCLRRSAFTAIAAAMAAAGCASSGVDGDQTVRDSTDPRPMTCMFSSTIRDFTTLDDRNLILDAPGNRAYHVVLATPSINIETEFRIAVVDRDRDGRICSYGRDRILIDGPLTEQVSIRSIEQIDEIGVEALKVRFGLIEPATEEAVTVTEIE